MPQTGQPLIITVHGTFAGIPNSEFPHWWQANAELKTDIETRLGKDAFATEPFIWNDEERTGPNRESERARAGQKLFQRLQLLESTQIPYHLVGHSHGGSVIWHALKLSAARDVRLKFLRSWTTVATPYFELGPDLSVWRRTAAAFAVIFALYWIGFWSLLPDLFAGARNQGLSGLVAKLPLASEVGDIRVALGDPLFFTLAIAFALVVALFALTLILPFADLGWHILMRPRMLASERRAKDWYGQLWLGIAHPRDEAIAGLKATLIPAPNLVLRRRRGLVGYVLRLFDPAAKTVDEFAWSVLMRNAQGCDVYGSIVQRVGATPRSLEALGTPMPPEVASRVQQRADVAASGVLARFRDKLEPVGNQADFTSLAEVLSGTYDDHSLIHTTMFDDPWVRSTIADHVARIVASPTEKKSALLAPRIATPPVTLSAAKALLAVGLIVVATVLVTSAYRIFVYGETNFAAAERVLARFDDPAFQAVASEPLAGEALVRALRLGMPLPRIFAAAAKLRDDQTQSQAYQLIMRDVLSDGRAEDLLRTLVTPPARGEPVPPYRLAPHLALALTAGLDFLARSDDPRRATAEALLNVAAVQITQGFKGDAQKRVLQRLIPAALAFGKWDEAVAWARAAFTIDPQCNSWNALIADAASIVTTHEGIQTVEKIIAQCNLRDKAEDKQRLLRRVAVGAARSCELAKPLLSQASFNRAGDDAPVPPRFLECLAASGRRADAEKLSAAARAAAAESTAPAPGIADLWRTSQSLAAAGLAQEAARWADLAVKHADKPTREQLESSTDTSFANDTLRLRMLRQISPDRHAAFLNDLRAAAESFHNDTSRSFSASWAALRYIHARYVDVAEGKTCAASASDMAIIDTIIKIMAYYPEKNPSSAILAVLRLKERCEFTVRQELFDQFFAVVSANNNAADRGINVAHLAPFRFNLRQGMATADNAALPASILRGYVATLDRHRPSILSKPRSPFVPIRFEKPS